MIDTFLCIIALLVLKCFVYHLEMKNLQKRYTTLEKDYLFYRKAFFEANFNLSEFEK